MKLATALILATVAEAFVQPTFPAFVRSPVSLKASTFEAQAEVAAAAVTYQETKHKLYWVDSVNDIDDTKKGPSDKHSDVDAYELKNNRGVIVKAMAKGANLVQLNLGGNNFVWDNVEGACYYGGKTNNCYGTKNENTTVIDPDAFPLKRGLILNGGIRYAAVTAEHGLYYDIDWNVTIDERCDDQKSIIFSIVDNETNRNRTRDHTPDYEGHKDVPKGFGQGQFNRQDKNTKDDFMTKYPVTNMEFRYIITLRKDEDFVRLRMEVHNPGVTNKQGEAWLPMTFPITTDSQILSKQDLRWRRDTWCFEDLPNMVPWENHPLYDKPLSWPASGIFYDFPRKDGTYHGVTTDPHKGQGVVCYTPEDLTAKPQYTKMWSWGDKTKFDRKGDIEKLKSSSNLGEQQGLALALGRPSSEYYEPWSSGTNFAFFQNAEFEGRSVYSWEVAILPITKGLESADKKVLRSVVDAHINKRSEQLKDVEGSKVTKIDEGLNP